MSLVSFCLKRYKIRCFIFIVLMITAVRVQISLPRPGFNEVLVSSPVFKTLARYDGSLFTNKTSFWGRLEKESFQERLFRVFPRSSAEKRFKRKTAVSRDLLVMNAGLILVKDDHYAFASPSLDAEGVSVLLVFRASLTEWGPSDLYFTLLDSHLVPRHEPRVLSQAHSFGGTWYGPPWREDPRLFVHGTSELGIAYTVTCAYERNSHGYQVWQRQAFALLSRVSLSLRISDIFLNYGNNSDFGSTIYPYFEKNWLYFSYMNELHVLYTVEPLIILRVEDFLFPKPFKHVVWQHTIPSKYGTLRGSAPPVFVDGSWWIFTHSASYAIFVLVLSNLLQPVAVTKSPIFFTEEQMFVCGAVFFSDRQEWVLSAGSDDTHVVLLSVPHRAVVGLLSSVYTT